MVTSNTALSRLRKEADYEEKISNDLGLYFLESLDEIKDLSEEEKIELNEKIEEILNDSVKHNKMIVGLIDYILQNAKDKY